MTALAYGLSLIFTGRAMFIHIGAALATIMVVNVLHVIIPNQRRMVDALLKGETPDPALAEAAKRQSVHNTYFTLPVLFLMISNHYPITYSSHWNWLILLAVALIGAAVRRVFVLRHTHRQKAWMLPAAGIAFAALAILATPRHAQAPSLLDSAYPAAPFPVVQAIIEARCATCHAQHPTMTGFDTPPQGLVLDSPDQIVQQAARIEKMAVASDAMPLGNITGMTPEERTILGRWIASGSRR
jgi:uncharacterized membrane protein